MTSGSKYVNRYLLKWTSGNESLETMHRFFNPDLTLDGMLQRIKEMIVNTPTPIAEIVKFGCCVGLRSAEIVESVRLINDREAFPKYYDSVQMTLCHYKFKQFLRSTKKAFLSYITPQALEPIQNLTKVPTYSSIRHICNRRRMPCNLHLCRKVFASWLHESGFSDITIDMLQGRCPQSGTCSALYFTKCFTKRQSFAGYTPVKRKDKLKNQFFLNIIMK